MSLANQTIVIIGGSSGIGLATAKAARAEGARIILAARPREKLDRAASELDAGTRAFALDIADEAAVRSMFQRIDHLDHIFSTAGTLVSDPKLAPETSAMRPAMDTRFWGAVYAAKYGAPKMTSGGSITFMSGTASQRPRLGASVGSASGAAVEGLARALALDLAPIRVNTICPGLVDTPLIDQFMGERKQKMMEAFAARLPVHRIGQPEDIADAVLFLMRNGYVTGISLHVDGGALLI